MSDTLMAGSDRLGAKRSDGSAARLAALAIGGSAFVSAAIWLAGTAAGVPFLVTIFLGGFEHHVSLVEVILATVFGLAVGYGLLAAASRRSSRWVAAVVAVGVVFAVGSAGGALAAGNDPGSGGLLATMHLAATAVFVATASRFAARAAGR